MESKTNLRLKLKVSVTFVWVGALIALMAKMFGPWCLVAGLSIAVIAGIYRYTMIRCPRCGHKLIDGKTIPARCPKCDQELL